VKFIEEVPPLPSSCEGSEIDGITAALFVTATSAASSPLKAGSVEVAAAVTMV
jgi:hypothetical protein